MTSGLVASGQYTGVQHYAALAHHHAVQQHDDEDAEVRGCNGGKGQPARRSALCAFVFVVDVQEVIVHRGFLSDGQRVAPDSQWRQLQEPDPQEPDSYI